MMIHSASVWDWLVVILWSPMLICWCCSDAVLSFRRDVAASIQMVTGGSGSLFKPSLLESIWFCKIQWGQHRRWKCPHFPQEALRTKPPSFQPAKKSNKPRIITWIPFPVWFSLSVEGFGVITDYLVIEMGTSVGKWWCPFFCEKKTRSLEIFSNQKKAKGGLLPFQKKILHWFIALSFFFGNFHPSVEIFQPPKRVFV